MPDSVLYLFDGDCLLCSRSVRFFAARDRHDRLRFATLQGPRGREILARLGEDPPDSMVVATADRIFLRSDAVLAALAQLPFPWSALARLARLIPRPLRDVAYDFIASRRYRWFGKNDACELPTEALRRRMLEN